MYFSQTNDTDQNKYDIVESGGSVVAKSIPEHLIEKIVDFLNSLDEF